MTPFIIGVTISGFQPDTPPCVELFLQKTRHKNSANKAGTNSLDRLLINGAQKDDLEFQCLATWKDGNDKFLYGGFSGSGIVSSQDIYRCFVSAARLATSPPMAGPDGAPPVRVGQDGPDVADLLPATRPGTRTRHFRPALQQDHPGRWRGICSRGLHLGRLLVVTRMSGCANQRSDTGRGHVLPSRDASPSRRRRALPGKRRRIGDSHRTKRGPLISRSLPASGPLFHDSFYQCMRIKRIKDDVVEFSQGPPNSYQIDFCDSETGYKEKKILFRM
ncbi:hypothetical protein LSH36_731g00002 [Paralvinella palmiformis]|uniref:Uncharacterized protein n=1 Tax=Paralvinella palmiformis TaxID=53620 RepID=A0AAD9J1C1_9ANNE|nr:hypothetical protein LSH36_731g00002 [Paralvinella palmiformis]